MTSDPVAAALAERAGINSSDPELIQKYLDQCYSTRFSITRTDGADHGPCSCTHSRVDVDTFAIEEIRHTGVVQLRAEHVPAVRPHALDPPQPQKRGADIDPAIGRIAPPGVIRGGQREKPAEGKERGHSRRQPPGGGTHPPPGPDGEAARDLCDRGGQVKDRRRSGDHDGSRQRLTIG